jgi:exonuclease SbcC
LTKLLAQVQVELPTAKSEAHSAEKACTEHQGKVKATRSSANKASEATQASARQRLLDEKTCDALRFQQATYLESLPEAWKLRWPLDATAIQSHVRKLNTLTKSNIKAQYEALSADTELARSCQSRLQVLEQQMKQLPKEAHRPALELQKQLEDCKQLFNQIDKEHMDANQRHVSLIEQQRQYAKYSTQAAAAEKVLTLHQKLDELLGKDGLQRDLVRSAERNQAESASQTLKNLTNGELTLELNTSDDKDAAFDLVVRQQNHSHDIGVNYLSGSQKFRVSVAIALAIGKYASGRNRPLESVIIDEGFGSLDRDGLATMADELITLQKNAALKRIILVSHQEDFVDRFPVGYSLTPGEHGTTATLWRR